MNEVKLKTKYSLGQRLFYIKPSMDESSGCVKFEPKKCWVRSIDIKIELGKTPREIYNFENADGFGVFLGSETVYDDLSKCEEQCEFLNTDAPIKMLKKIKNHKAKAFQQDDTTVIYVIKIRNNEYMLVYEDAWDQTTGEVEIVNKDRLVELGIKYD